MIDSTHCIVCGKLSARFIGFGSGPAGCRPLVRCEACDPPNFSTPESKRLRQERVHGAQGPISLRDAAKMLGVSAAELSGWETGRVAISDEKVERILAVYRNRKPSAGAGAGAGNGGGE